jgi:hypothetical protein
MSTPDLRPSYVEQIIEQPVMIDMQEREVAFLKSNYYLLLVGSLTPNPSFEKWLAVFEENNQTIFVTGYRSSASQEEFQSIFDQVIGSFQLLDTDE